MRSKTGKLNHVTIANLVQYLLLGIIMVLCLIPIMVGLLMSFKTTSQIHVDFFSLPNPIQWGNYSAAAVEMIGPLGNTLVVAFSSIFGGLIFSCLAAYAFARLYMFGKKALFMLILCLMMMPGVLTLTPSFILANQLGLRDNHLGLILFYIAGAQAFSIFLLRIFFEDQPEELFESARIDGANEMQSLVYIALPLSRAILITIAIMNMLSYYNDLIFPMLMLVSRQKQTLMVMMQRYVPQQMAMSRPDIARQVAGYMLACIPQLIIFAGGMKYYIQGVTSGAIKG